MELTSHRWTPGQKESDSYSKGNAGEVMIGREHRGDENGTTRYRYATVSQG
ncbi:hypothetical protein ABT255_46055 [Streptomyces mirabilis]|uniref:hypothetical protein n=1 Tax=Streptomyces mirabilis TaxID=68239 RepID=UPI003317B356